MNRLLFKNNIEVPKGKQASFKEIHIQTLALDWLGTVTIKLDPSIEPLSEKEEQTSVWISHMAEYEAHVVYVQTDDLTNEAFEKIRFVLRLDEVNRVKSPILLQSAAKTALPDSPTQDWSEPFVPSKMRERAFDSDNGQTVHRSGQLPLGRWHCG